MRVSRGTPLADARDAMITTDTNTSNALCVVMAIVAPFFARDGPNLGKR